MRVILALASGWNFDGPAPFQIKRNRLYVIDLAPTLRLQDTPVRLVEDTTCA
jgi:probable phosphoglycerate mutase